MDVLQDADRIINENTVHVVGGNSSQIICSSQHCGNQLSSGVNVERGNNNEIQ